MCTVLLRLRPGAEWPLQLAFVRDEDRDRHADPPDRWWPDQPTVIGGRDARAGGTWLAVDDAGTPSVALLTDQYDPGATLPDPAHSPTRGMLPLRALAAGREFDARRDVPGTLETYQSFHLATIELDASGKPRLRVHSWSGTEFESTALDEGDHVVASRALTLPGEPERRQLLLARLDQVDDRLASGVGTHEAWHDWVDVLDSRDVAPGQVDQLAIHSIPQRPGFGTVGASLVAIAADGRVRYDVNRTNDLAPDGWQVALGPASAA